VTKAYLEAGDYTLEVAGTEYPAIVSLQPMYDPTNARIKA
jgi:glycine cleavage system aminomethyltransferase T